MTTSTDTDDVDDAEDQGTGVGTTETDYRWRWLSTIWALVYGLGFPTWVLVDGVGVDGVLLAAFTVGWGATVIYVVGPENVRAWRDLRGGQA